MLFKGDKGRRVALFFWTFEDIIMTDKNLQDLKAGDPHYKAFVGPPLKYDLLGALQFSLLSAAGLRADHKLCDIGCGSLRVGKLLIPYLNADNYFGLEPEKWLIEVAIDKEIGQDLINLKRPRFDHWTNFEISKFETKFKFILAQSIFSHANLNQIIQCLKEARQCLDSDGLFLATFIWGKEDYEGDDWVYPGCVAYRPSSIKKKAWDEAGLKMLTTDWPHPNGQNWVIFHLPGHELEAEKVSRFSLDKFEADVVAIPEKKVRSLKRYTNKVIDLFKK